MVSWCLWTGAGMTIAETHAGTTGIGNTEWSLTTDTVGPDTNTNDACVQVFLDLSALATGDKFRFRLYEKVLSTGAQRIVYQNTFANVQARPIWASPTLILLHGWDATLQKLAGTDRAISFSVRELTQTAPGVSPTISGFTPVSGDAGDEVTITGTNFNGVSQVLFGTTQSSLTIINDTTITTTVPSGITPDAYNITVATPSFSAVSSTTFHVATFSGPVTLTSTYTVPVGQVAEWDPFVTTTVTCDNVNFIVNGTIRQRPNAPSVIHTLRFTNINEAGVVGGGNVPLSTDPGLWVTDTGVMDCQGAARKTWLRATAGLTVGQTSFTVPAGHNWVNGDTLVFVPTAAGTSTQYDERTINSVAGDTIGISSGLTFAHPSVTLPNAQVILPEILNMTNNVAWEGQDITHRSHSFVRNTTPVVHTMKNVSIRYMGPRKSGLKIVGRWPTHFHHGGGNIDGQVIENVVVRDSGSHAFVAHDTDGITFLNCVAHNTQEHQYWWDFDLASDHPDRITYDSCIGSKVLFGEPGGARLRLSAFFLNFGGNPIDGPDDHICRNCIAVGVANEVDTSGYQWPEVDTTLITQQEGQWVFDNNIAHNNGAHGLFGWENVGTRTPPPNNNFIAYHNGRAGMRWGAYGFGVSHNNVVTYKNGFNYAADQVGSAELIIDAHDSTSQILDFRDCIFDGGGVNPHAIRIAETLNFPPPELTHYHDCLFTGFTQNVLRVNNTEPRGQNVYHDIVRPRIGQTERDMLPSDITVGFAQIGDRIRVQRQNNLSAFQWQWNGTSADVTEIAPFE